MADPTFVDLQDIAMSRDYGATVDRTNVKTWINEALRDVHQAHRWSWAETSTTISSVAGTETIALPSSVLWIGRIRPGDADAPNLTWVDPNQVSPDSPLAGFNDTSALGRGIPMYVSRWGSSLYLQPTPDAIYNWLIYFWRKAIALSADGDEPLMPEDDRDVLVYGALQRAAERDRDWDAAQVWKSRYDEKITMMKNKDNLLKQGTRRVQMPSGYYGRFR